MSSGCPKHGTKYLEYEGQEIYCMAPIPRDALGTTICYYHIPKKPGKDKTEICSCCQKRKATHGTLCKKCRNEKQKESYRNKKIQSE